MPMQTSMESEFARRAPAQYDYLRSFYMDPVTGRMGSRAYNTDVMGLDAGGMPTGGGDSGAAGTYNLPAFIPEGTRDQMASLATNPQAPSYYKNFRDVYDYNEKRAKEDPFGQTYGVPVKIAPSQVESWLPPTPSSGSSSKTKKKTAPSFKDTVSAIKSDFGKLKKALGFG